MTKERLAGIGFGVMIINQDKCILMGLRHSDAKKADSELRGEGTWTMPGGKLRFGETLTMGCVRETKEECDLDISSDNLKLISVSDDMVPGAHFVTIGFLTKDFKGTPKVMEPDEITEWRWFALDNLPNNIFFPSAKIIKNYLSGKIY